MSLSPTVCVAAANLVVLGGTAAVPGPPGGGLRHQYAQGRARVFWRLQGLLERHFRRSLRRYANIPSCIGPPLVVCSQGTLGGVQLRNAIYALI